MKFILEMINMFGFYSFFISRVFFLRLIVLKYKLKTNIINNCM